MNTKILEYVIAVAEEGAVTKAAQRFLLTRPALLHHIRSIEEELGAPLFVRSPNGLTLTPAGIIYINDAKAILRIQKETEQAIHDIAMRKKNLLRVALDDTMYNVVVRRVIPEFQEQNPDCQVELTKCNAVQVRQLLQADKAELGAYVAMTPYAKGLNLLNVQQQTLRLVFPPDYSGPTDSEHLFSLLDSGYLPVLHPVGTTIRNLEEQRLAEMHIYPQKFIVGHYADVLNYLETEKVIGFLPQGICDVVQNRRIVVGDVFMQVHDLLAYSPNRTVSAEQQALMLCMFRHFTSGEFFDPFRPCGKA